MPLYILISIFPLSLAIIKIFLFFKEDMSSYSGYLPMLFSLDRMLFSPTHYLFACDTYSSTNSPGLFKGLPFSTLHSNDTLLLQLITVRIYILVLFFHLCLAFSFDWWPDTCFFYSVKISLEPGKTSDYIVFFNDWMNGWMN
jgi:hypothetical protein